jgi:hypothetical protein
LRLLGFGPTGRIRTNGKSADAPPALVRAASYGDISGKAAEGCKHGREEDPWPSQSVAGLIGGRAAMLPPNAEYALLFDGSLGELPART